MMQQLRGIIVFALAVVGPSVLTAQEPAVVTLAVPGHTNATPWIAADGGFVAVVWGATRERQADVYVATSADGGTTFGPPVRVNAEAGEARVSGEIPPRVALHRRPGAARPDVVVAWNAKDPDTAIKVARSRDGGRTFARPLALQAAGAPGDRGWHALTVDATGTAHVVWLDHRGLAEAKAAEGHTAPTAAGTIASHGSGDHDGVAMAQRSRLYYARVGETASVETAVTPGVCYCCKTALVATPRGVLAAWRHVYAGNLRDMAFAWLGATAPASEPPRVSHDGWAINGCPDDGPALATDAAGAAHIVWPTVIPGPEPLGALFYAVMRDGGAFAPRQRVPTLGAPKPSHPQVVIDATGRIVVAWDEIVDGVRTAAVVSGVVTGEGTVAFGRPARLAPPGPSAYPVMAVAGDTVLAAWTAGPPSASSVRVRRIDAAGGLGGRAR